MGYQSAVIVNNGKEDALFALLTYQHFGAVHSVGLPQIIGHLYFELSQISFLLFPFYSMLFEDPVDGCRGNPMIRHEYSTLHCFVQNRRHCPGGMLVLYPHQSDFCLRLNRTPASSISPILWIERFNLFTSG